MTFDLNWAILSYRVTGAFGANSGIREMTTNDDRGQPGLMRSALRLLWEKKWWWLVPIILIIGLMTLLVLLTPESAQVPFIYQIF